MEIKKKVLFLKLRAVQILLQVTLLLFVLEAAHFIKFLEGHEEKLSYLSKSSVTFCFRVILAWSSRFNVLCYVLNMSIVAVIYFLGLTLLF